MKLIIFDMDGTLVDSLDTISYYVNCALKKFGFPELENEKIKSFVGDGRRKLIERCVNAAGGDSSYSEKVESAFSEEYNKNPLYLSKPCKGLMAPFESVTTALKRIKKLGVKTAIVSNKPHNLVKTISDTLFGDLIDEVSGAKENMPLKPDPSMLLEIIDKFGAEKDECIYVGDTVVDIKTAENAGIFSVGVLWGCCETGELSKAGANMITYMPWEIVAVSAVESTKNLRQKGYIPKYWNSHLEEKINKIKDTQIKAGENSLSFGLFSDIHWNLDKIKYTPALIEKIATECNVPYIFNGGDTVSGAGTCPPEHLINELTSYSEAFKDLEPKILMAQGNHDSAYSEFTNPPKYYAQNITKEEIFQHIFKYETKYPDRVMSKDGSYFYVDHKNSKTRLVVMNPYDVPNDEVNDDGTAKYNKMRLAGYRETQLKWFANEALNVPDNKWTVVLCTHTNPASKELCRNEDVVLNIIDAFRNSSSYKAESVFDDIPDYTINFEVDFKDKGGDFAVWLCGHTHQDRTVIKNGTLCISIISEWNHQAENLPFIRYSGTVLEHAFDIFTIDAKNHKLYVTRVGAGCDREFNYEYKA